MKTLVLSAAIFVGYAVQASASDQLALSLGVEPGAYSLNELAQLKAAMDSDDQARIRAILNGSEAISTQSLGITPGHQQLAASIDVDPNDFSTAEIVAIRAAIEDDDATRARFLMNGDAVVSTRSFGFSAGHEQIARSLGVNPADYTLAELTEMKADSYDDN